MHYKFPYNFVFWQKVENHEEIKKKYYQKILDTENIIKNNNDWVGDVKTSYNNPELNNFLYQDSFSANVIWPYFDNMLMEIEPDISKHGYIPVESYVASIWYNMYDKGHFQETHQHDRNYKIVNNTIHTNAYCGIYLLHLESENETVFYQEPPVPCSIDNSGVNFTTKFLHEGNVIFFPSGLSHYVLPAKAKRCTISFNITSVYSN